MTLQVEILRVKSPELMRVVEDAAKKLHDRNRGHFSIELRVERIADTLLSYNLKTYYILMVRFENGRFEPGGAKFEFMAETEDGVYRFATMSIKAWADEYFKEAEPPKL